MQWLKSYEVLKFKNGSNFVCVKGTFPVTNICNLWNDMYQTCHSLFVIAEHISMRRIIVFYSTPMCTTDIHYWYIHATSCHSSVCLPVLQDCDHTELMLLKSNDCTMLRFELRFSDCTLRLHRARATEEQWQHHAQIFRLYYWSQG